MAKIVGVKFRNTSKVYYFAPESETTFYEEGTGVIVETAKGQEYGKVVFGVKEVLDSEIVQPLKKILHKASKKEEEQIKKNRQKIPNAMKVAEEKIAKCGLDMKLVSAEYSFDGKKLTYYFSSDGRVDFRELVKELASVFHVRIELTQIGPRDEAKLLGGIAPCGRACCCSGHIPDFSKVSIKMAKTQGLALNPTKINGLCGRLMCCLAYENDYYAEIAPKMPKVGSQVKTEEGEGTVVSTNMLKMEVKVKISKDKDVDVYKDFALKDIKFFKKPTQNETDDEENEENF